MEVGDDASVVRGRGRCDIGAEGASVCMPRTGVGWRSSRIRRRVPVRTINQPILTITVLGYEQFADPGRLTWTFRASM